MSRTSRKPAAGTSLAPNTITRTEAYQRVRSAAAQAFADERASRGARIQEFEQNYGSTSDLDESFVRDMRAMATRAQALSITLGEKRNSYSSDVTPNKAMQNVARVLAGAIGEVEFFLSQRRARTLFEPPVEEDYLAKTYGGSVGDPRTWVGPRAQKVVDQVLAGLTIVDAGPEPSSVPALVAAAKQTCAHDQLLEREDAEVSGEPGGATCAACDLQFFDLVNDGKAVRVQADVFNFLAGAFLDEEDGVTIRLPKGRTLDELLAMGEKQRRKAAEAWEAELEAERERAA